MIAKKMKDAEGSEMRKKESRKNEDEKETKHKFPKAHSGEM